MKIKAIIQRVHEFFCHHAWIVDKRRNGLRLSYVCIHCDMRVDVNGDRLP